MRGEVKMLSFGQRLKIIRKGVQLTQSELAEKLMVSVQSISKWECDNSMPDISQIVPLSAILGVTTDCLLGVGGDEKVDREKLYIEVEKINKNIEKVYQRNDNAYYECYKLYREHIKKYPLDFEIKLLCADSLVRCLYYGTDAKEEKDKFYQEAVTILRSIINCDRDTTRLIDAQQTLVILYLYHDDFTNAEEIARGLPQKGSLRTSMEIEIYSKKNDHTKCIELSESACNEAVHHYLWALAMRAKRISLFGNEKKQEAIIAWCVLVDEAKKNYEIFHDAKIKTKWLYSALNNLSNDYIAISQINKALDVIEELTSVLIHDYNECKKRRENTLAESLKNNFRFYLHSCYNLQYCTEENEISNDPRFKKCEMMLNNID